MSRHVCLACEDGYHADCEPVFDMDTEELHRCDCAANGHDLAGVEEEW